MTELSTLKHSSLVYNGCKIGGGSKAIASPNPDSRKYNNRKANAIKTEIEVGEYFSNAPVNLGFIARKGIYPFQNLLFLFI